MVSAFRGIAMPTRSRAELEVARLVRADPAGDYAAWPQEKGPTEVHALDVTPALRRAALGEGFPLFARPREDTDRARKGLGYQSPVLRAAGYHTSQERASIRDALTENLRAELDRLGLPDVHLRVVDRIEAWLDGRLLGADGRYFEKAIDIALNARQAHRSVLNHEVIHALRALGLFTDKEWALLARASERKWRKQFDIDRLYAGATKDTKIEEGVAHGFSAFRDGEKAHGYIGRLFQRIRDFLRALGNALRRLVGKEEVSSAEDIFRAIKSGEIGRRVRAAAAAERTEAAKFSTQPSAPRRTGLPASAAVMQSHRNFHALKRHPDYNAAKSGDYAAAFRLVRDNVSDELIAQARQQFGPDAIYAPVVAIEQQGYNAIPGRLAQRYAETAGGTVADDLRQTNRPFHTGAKAMERLITRAQFAGDVVPGGKYVLVDDVTVMGSTLADLAEHIQQGGGNVIGVVTLVNASRSARLAATPAQVRAIERRFGDVIEQLFGLQPASLTYPEAFYLLNFRDADSLRARVAAAQRERSARLRAKGIGEGAGEEKPGGGVAPSQEGESGASSGAASDSGPTKEPKYALSESGKKVTTRIHGAIERFFDLTEEARQAVAPMSTGSAEARAIAKDFANAMRLARYRWRRRDELIKQNFTPEQRKRMWEAADAESVARQTGVPTKAGLDTLSPDERAVVASLQDEANRTWREAQAVGIVAEANEGLPSYVPRMMVIMGEGGHLTRERPRAGYPGNEEGIGPGLRTNTPQTKHRKYMTAEETEAAMQAKFGPGARIARDIRALNLGTAKLQEAIAGRALINEIRRAGSIAGEELVREGSEPGEGRWFTLDHPAFKTWKPVLRRNPETGKWEQAKYADGSLAFERVPIFIRSDFRGPLQAILQKEGGAV